MAKKKEVQVPEVSVRETLTGFIQLADGETPEQKAKEFNTLAMAIKITSVEQSDDFKVARENLTLAVKTRTTIDKIRKSKKQAFLDAGKIIDDEAKRLTALFSEPERHLDFQVKEFERLEQVEKDKKANALKERQKFLIDHHFPYNGECFAFTLGEENAEVTIKQVQFLSDEDWQTLLEQDVLPRFEKKEKELEKEAKELERLRNTPHNIQAEYPLTPKEAIESATQTLDTVSSGVTGEQLNQQPTKLVDSAVLNRLTFLLQTEVGNLALEFGRDDLSRQLAKDIIINIVKHS